MRILASAAVLLALAAPAVVQAQQQTTTMAIRVVDPSNAAVPGARVELVGTRVSGVTGDSGWVRLQRVPVGSSYLRVTRIGYAPMETIVQLAAGAPFEADVELARAPVAVSPVTARSTAQNPALNTSGFYTRKERGFGVFLTQDDIARSGARRTSDVFRRISGVRVVATENNHHKLQSARYGMSMSRQDQGAFSKFSTRDGPGRDGTEGRDNGSTGEAPRVCEMLTIIDGVPVRLDDIDDVHLENIGAVEVYRGPSELPAEFNQTGAVCGAVVMWTRTPTAAAGATPAQPAGTAPANPTPAP